MIRPIRPRHAGAPSAPSAPTRGGLPQELRAAGIIDMQAANRYLDQVYRPAFNAEFQVTAREAGSAVVPGSESASTRSCASTSSVRWTHDNCVRLRDAQTADPGRPPPLPLRQTKVAGASAMPMVRSRCSMARGFWVATSAMAR